MRDLRLGCCWMTSSSTDMGSPLDGCGGPGPAAGGGCPAPACAAPCACGGCGAGTGCGKLAG
eukprot:scaffold110148_cov33-Phaeocystis_antarctica.AAC.1